MSVRTDGTHRLPGETGTLGKYRLLDTIGSGGMGVVVRAFDPVLERFVAIKRIRLAGGGEDSVRRFYREARGAAAVNHPNLVTVYETDDRDGQPFIVMELVQGVTAAEMAARLGALPWAKAARVVREVCGGLAAIHKAGLIHRDVKPSNVLISHAGEVKLSDFGLAKVVGRDTLSQASGVISGTPDYMSPEQCRNEPLDLRTDLYSLGGTFHALLTGRPPFVADTPVQMMFAHCGSPIPDPRALVPALPEGCGRILRRAMAKEPRDRYPTADDFRADLDQLLDGTATFEREPVRVRVTARVPALPPVEPLPRGPHRRTALTVAAALAASAVVGTVGWFVAGRKRETDAGGGERPVDDSVAESAFKLDGIIRHIAVTPDGRKVAASIQGGDRPAKGIRWFDVAGSKLRRAGKEFESDDCWGIAFTSTGKWMFVGCNGNERFIAHDRERGKDVAWPGTSGLKGSVLSVAISPDGTHVAVGISPWAADGAAVVRVWPIAEPDKVFDLGPCSGRSIRQIAWVTDDRGGVHLAVASSTDGAHFLERWTPETRGHHELELKGKCEFGLSVAAVEGGIVYGAGRVLMTRHAVDFRLESPMVELPGEVSAVAVAPDGTVAASVGESVHLFAPRTLAKAGVFNNTGGTSWGLAFHPDGRTLYCGGEDWTLRALSLSEVHT